MVRDIHQTLMSCLTVDAGLQRDILSLAQEHPANVVMSLLRCAPTCDRYTAQLPRELGDQRPLGPLSLSSLSSGVCRTGGQLQDPGAPLFPEPAAVVPPLPLGALGLCHPAPRSRTGHGTDAQLRSHRAAALMWRTIGSSGSAAHKVLPALLAVTEDRPHYSMFFHSGDNEAIFVLAVSFWNWPLLTLQVTSPAALHALSLSCSSLPQALGRKLG